MHSMKTLVVAILTATATAAASSDPAKKVVQWDLNKRHPADVAVERANIVAAAPLEKRATIMANLGNTLNLYYVNVSVGTPPQQLELQLDTGSSDVWMIKNGISDCQGLRADCTGGYFNPGASSTYAESQPGVFNISYADSTGAQGDYITDNISIGNVQITNQTMGLALQTTIERGLVGVGYDNNEAVCKTDSCPNRYPSIIDQMMSQGKINTRAYSLWLNDVTQSTGNILFGGIDTSRYTGQLTALPLLRTGNRQSVSAFAVAWTDLTITTPNGVQRNFVSDNFETAAILDSGTSTAVFPSDVVDSLVAQFGGVFSRQAQQYLAPCYLRTSNATLDFQFGGNGGPIIHVPVSEFLLDATTSRRKIHFNDGSDACILGFMPGPASEVILGDTFLRSAYVVYDIDHNQVAIAQTNFNGGRSNVQEIQSAGIPDVSSTASQTVAATGIATGLPGNFGQSTDAGGDSSPTSTVGSSNDKPPLAAFTTARYTGQGGYLSGSSQGAAAGVRAPQLQHEGLAVAALMTVFAVIGSGVLLL